MEGVFAAVFFFFVHRYLTGELPILDMVKDNRMGAIPEILGTLPLGGLAIVVFIIVALIFLTTTLDSTTYTIAAYTSTLDMSKNEPPKILRILVAGIITVISLVLMRIGGLAPLEV
ncbi:BCCT family transporter, partial [Rossellomorea aquimaris]|uniref:BCCT family transporter n=1 Tax=Rossellomorea aquimaris TaxID=189382 RepID=UPI003F812EED